MAIVSMSYAEMNPKTAEQITYDNSTSGLEAENVQDALDELDAIIKKPKEAKILFSGTAQLNTVYDLNETLNPYDTLPTEYLIRIGAGEAWFCAQVFLIVGTGEYNSETTFPIGIKSNDADSIGMMTIQILAGNKTFKVIKNTTNYNLRQIIKLPVYTMV